MSKINLFGDMLKVFLLFLGPIIFVDTPTAVNGSEGSDIFLRCEATNAKTEWLIDGEIPNNGNLLFFLMQNPDSFAIFQHLSTKRPRMDCT